MKQLTCLLVLLSLIFALVSCGPKVMSYAEYDAAAMDAEVVVDVYVQAHQSWWDKGFGSLDGTSLQSAVNTLYSLSEGCRLVGIISHVGELREQIDRQIQVTKDASGDSKIRICV